jgi:hypothetical protein
VVQQHIPDDEMIKDRNLTTDFTDFTDLEMGWRGSALPKSMKPQICVYKRNGVLETIS